MGCYPNQLSTAKTGTNTQPPSAPRLPDSTSRRRLVAQPPLAPPVCGRQQPAAFPSTSDRRAPGNPPSKSSRHRRRPAAIAVPCTPGSRCPPCSAASATPCGARRRRAPADARATGIRRSPFGSLNRDVDAEVRHVRAMARDEVAAIDHILLRDAHQHVLERNQLGARPPS